MGSERPVAESTNQLLSAPAVISVNFKPHKFHTSSAMKKTFVLTVLLFCVGLVQSCKDTATEPVFSKKELLTRTAWKMVEGMGEVGEVTKFLPDGTLWAEGSEGQWRFGANENSLILTEPEVGDFPAEILRLTTTELHVRTTMGPFVMDAKFIADPSFSERKFLLVRFPWTLESTSDPERTMNASVTFRSNGILIQEDLETGKADTTAWEFADNEQKLRITYGQAVETNEILELTQNRLKLRVPVNNQPVELIFTR